MSARWVFSWGMSIVFAMLSNMGCSNRPVVVRIIDGQTVQGRFVHPEAYALVMEGQLAEQRGWLAQAERLYLAALRYQPNDASILVRLLNPRFGRELGGFLFGGFTPFFD